MIVQYRFQMSGGRWDDRQWPPAWTDFEVPDWEGENQVKGGMAVFIRPSAPDVQLPGPAAENTVMSAPSQTGAGPVPPDNSKLEWGKDDAPAAGAAPAVGETPPPPAASKQTWIEYAVSQGADDDTVGNFTKQQLMEQYGGRP